MQANKLSILLVEDSLADANLQRLALMGLSEAEIEITHVERLIDAVRLTKDQPFDAILLDLGLPDSAGLNTVKSIVKATSSTPVLVVTGSDEPDIAQRAISLGAQEFIVKGTIRPGVLVRLIEHAVERQELQVALRTKNNELTLINHQLRRIIADHGDAMLIIDKDGVAQFVNPTAERLFDRPGNELIGAVIGIPIGSKQDPEITIIRPDGQTMTVDMRVTPTMWDGRPVFLAALRDISQRKEVEAALKASATDARTASEMKSAFLANMSHELRTPLNSMLGFIDAIRQGVHGPMENEKYQEYLELALNSGHELLEMIDDLLDKSKIEANRIELKEGVFRFDTLVREALGIVTPLINKAGLRSRNMVGRLNVNGDAKRYKQVLLNLISNAIKFSRSGGEIVVMAEVASNGDLLVSVTDSGIGIADHNLELVFGQYAQVGNSTSELGTGTGLGLAICKQLVELHGGQIYIESMYGRWTKVTFTVPASRIVDPVFVSSGADSR